MQVRGTEYSEVLSLLGAEGLDLIEVKLCLDEIVSAGQNDIQCWWMEDSGAEQEFSDAEIERIRNHVPVCPGVLGCDFMETANA